MHSPVPFIWYNNDLKEVIEFYKTVFDDVKEESITPIPEGAPGPQNQQAGGFSINGQKIYAINGGPAFTLNESFSLMVQVDTQEEVDRYWNALTADGGQESQCGWLKDKFGLSWQITPKILLEMMSDPDKERSGKAMQAMLKMRKINIAELKEAVDG